MKWENALKDYQLFLKIERGLYKNPIDNYALDVKKAKESSQAYEVF